MSLNRGLFGGDLTMKCPYCNCEMELGHIQSNQEITWFKGLKPHFLNNSEFHEDSVLLSKFKYFSRSSVKAYLCRNCQKVIIDYSDFQSDLTD